ncbi:MAG TPA: hypothetical protein VLB44_04825, partial [Kofleriaceae bacterium]|nr:hypothetical protein [Kofleriaceae bacterium]
VVNRDPAPVGELSLRIERMGKTLIGGEASLWFVDGLHAQGRVLATFASRLGDLRRLELGGGGGVALGTGGAGPAVNLTLRTKLVRHVATYLRYDGALLLHDGTYDGQNAGSLGIEATW